MNINFRNASFDDVNQIFNIIHEYAGINVILGRNKRDIRESIKTFRIAENNSKIVGIISYYDYGPKLKEIRSLVVKKSLQNKGIGSQLVTLLVNYLKKHFSDVKIFVLTYSPVFFEKLDFKIIEKDSLPEKIWKDCQNCKYKNNCREIALILN